MVAEFSDIAVTINGDGVVRSLTINPESFKLGYLDHWLGHRFEEFLTVESRKKFADRMARIAAEDETALRRIELNHTDSTIWEFPVRYTIHENGHPGEFLLVGQDLRSIAQVQQQLIKAQLSLEQDYEAYREIESRYRLLLDMVQEPVVIVDCASGRVVELNDAAARLLGSSAGTLTGTIFAQAFSGLSRGDFLEALRGAGPSSGTRPLQMTTRHDGKSVDIHPRLFRTNGDILAMCRLSGANAATGKDESLGRRLASLYYNAADAVVFTDARGNIVDANEAFLILSSATHLPEVQGRSLADFLARGSVDLKVLIDNATRIGRMRNFGTKAISALGAHFSVEISVTALRNASEPGFGFVIRDMTPGMSGAQNNAGVDNRALQSVVELVGSAPLKELVSATTDVVEKMCIEAAVELTNNNRVAAAEMLGLSRQSLYVKLRKFGLLSQNNRDE